MSPDDILFEPIGNSNNSNSLVDQQMVDAVKIALTGAAAIEFLIDSGMPFDTYQVIADLIENDIQVVKYTRQMVAYDPNNLLVPGRPANALSISDVFRRLYNGQDNFWLCGKNDGNGIRENRFLNWFSVDSKIPVLALDAGLGSGIGNVFEWWIVGLMSKFIGYQQHYAFATEAEAQHYYSTP